MFFHDIIKRKEYLDKKLKDVSNFIKSLKELDIDVDSKALLYNKALDLKFKLLNKIRSHEVLIQNLSEETAVTIGDETMSLYEAEQLLSTIEAKIETVENILLGGDLKVINFFSLLEQRDQLFEEHMVLYTAVYRSIANKEWSG